MGVRDLEVYEDGLIIDGGYVDWKDIKDYVVKTYRKNHAPDIMAVRGILDELRWLADDIEEEF
jgi:hypothetical protein